MQRHGQSVSSAGLLAIIAICLILVGLTVGRGVAEMLWNIVSGISNI
jgi:hypothetical protein